MKKIINFFIALILIINLTCTSSLAVDMHRDDYVKVKLNRPLKSNFSVNLQSQYGFSVYSMEESLKEICNIEEKDIILSSGKGDLIDIKDKDNNTLFSFGNDDNIYLSSSNPNNFYIKVEEDNYRDYLTFNRVGNVISVFNYLTLDHYLYGVVPMEMPSSFPLESLKVQAIAARSFALANMNKHMNNSYNLCDSTDCQVYGGYDRETTHTCKAVDDTHGVVIKYNGEIVSAMYHSNSGGYTEDCENVWGGTVPYLRSVNDEFSLDAPNTNWKTVFSNEDIKNKLKNICVDIGDIVSIEPISRTESGRVTSLKIIGTKGEHTLEKDKIRQVLGYSEVKSNMFQISSIGDKIDNLDNNIYVIDGITGKTTTIKSQNVHVLNGDEKRILSNREIYIRILTGNGQSEIKDESKSIGNQFVIEGKGYGHGVGMSQWGARKMAEIGYNYGEILNHYYTGIDIVTEY